MAYINNEEDVNQQKAGASGVLAGSGGAASPTPTAQPAGSGFTNLQTYLGANKGQGAGVAGQIISEGQKGVDTARNVADQYADTWASTGVQQANQAGQDAASKYNRGAAEIQADPNKTDGAYAAAQGTVYGGPKQASDIKGPNGETYNDLEKNYQNVKKTADNFANDYGTQQAGLMKANNYGVGFGALDTFLGRQDGRDTIQSWQNGIQGSAAGQIGKVNDAISGAQRAVSDAQGAHSAAGMVAQDKRARAKAEADQRAADQAAEQARAAEAARVEKVRAEAAEAERVKAAAEAERVRAEQAAAAAAAEQAAKDAITGPTFNFPFLQPPAPTPAPAAPPPVAQKASAPAPSSQKPTASTPAPAGYIRDDNGNLIKIKSPPTTQSNTSNKSSKNAR